jgi:hypothetical protein
MGLKYAKRKFMKTFFAFLILSIILCLTINCSSSLKINKVKHVSTTCGDSLKYSVVDSSDLWIKALKYYKKAFLKEIDQQTFSGVRIYWLPSFEKEYLLELDKHDTSLNLYYPIGKSIAQDIGDSTHVIDSTKAIRRFGDSIGYKTYYHDLPPEKYTPGVRIIKVKLIKPDFGKTFQDSLTRFGIDSMKCVAKRDCPFGFDGTTAIIEVYKDTIINKFHYWVDDYIDNRYMWITKTVEEFYK